MVAECWQQPMGDSHPWVTAAPQSCPRAQPRAAGPVRRAQLGRLQQRVPGGRGANRRWLQGQIPASAEKGARPFPERGALKGRALRRERAREERRELERAQREMRIHVQAPSLVGLPAERSPAPSRKPWGEDGSSPAAALSQGNKSSVAARCCCPGEMSAPQHQAGHRAERCRSRPSCTGWGTKWEAVREPWGLGLPSGGNTVRLSFLGGTGAEEERRSFDLGEQ